MRALIEFQQVCKYYHMGDTTVVAADHISFQVYKGEFVAIVGQSGSGKSTCMNIIGCLDVPSEGVYRLDGRDVGQMNKDELAEIRNERLGFIFQQYNLLPKLNLLENVEVPLMYAGVPKGERRERAKVALELALKNIVSNKTRTLLTMLGIVIGVAAVIVIVGLGNGLEQYITDSFSSLGTNTLTVTVMSRGSTRTLSPDEMYEIVAENSAYLDLCSPTVSMRGYVKIGSETLTSTSVQGVGEDYLTISGDTLSAGRGLQYSDMAARSKVCVVGAYLDQAYYGGNAVGQTLRVGGESLTIVGVLAQSGEELEEGGADDCLYLPYYLTTLSELNSTDYSLTGWYDDFGLSAGGRIRILIATPY